MHIKRIQKELSEEIEKLRKVEKEIIAGSAESWKEITKGRTERNGEFTSGSMERWEEITERRMESKNDNTAGKMEKGQNTDTDVRRNKNKRLRCAKKGNSYQYYIGNKYIDKSRMKFIEELANREYCEKLLPCIREKIRELEKIQDELGYDFDKPEKVYMNLYPGRKDLVKPLFVPRNDFIQRWLEEPYDVWEIKDEEVSGAFYSQKGERMRSKSEIIIADTLSRYGVPYKYEYPLKLKDGRQVITKRPDFVALNVSTLETLIIEHLGLFDQERYFLRNIEKIDLYERNGYLIGKNLILLHETSNNALNTRTVEKYIEQFLL